MTEQTNETVTTAPAQQHPVITQEIVNAMFNTELTRMQYQDALTKFNAWDVTTENVAETQKKIQRVRAFIRTLGDIKTKGKEPALTECRYWDKAYNDILTPLQLSLSSKEQQLQTIVDKIAEENRLKEIERQRVDGIKREIDNFLLQQSNIIANATTPEQLITIEKTIGSHKGNKPRYQEFLPELVERSNELTPLIKKQKEFIKELEELKRQKEEAAKADNDRLLLELQEKEALVQHSIEGGKINVQETAIRMAIEPEIITVQPQQQAIKYRRQSWKWEVVNMKELYKKMPHLVELIPNKEKIDDLLATKKGDGSLKDTEDITIGGVRFFLEKLA